jgi:hypothetical protein
MVSPAAHTPYFGASFWRPMFACRGPVRNVGQGAKAAYDFDPTTSPEKSDMTRTIKKTTAEFTVRLMLNSGGE